MPTPMMWLLLWVNPSAHSPLPSIRSVMSSGMVEIKLLYCTVLPPASVTVLAPASRAVTVHCCP
jgi:hypothetical protein